MTEFLTMGGYGAFVWPAYAISFLVLAVMIVVTLRASRKTQQALSQISTADVREPVAPSSNSE